MSEEKKIRMQEQPKNLAQFIELLDEVLPRLKGSGKLSLVDDRDKWFSILFCCKFYEIVKDIEVLVSAGRFNSIPILLRAALEVSIDIKNIKASPKYLERLAYETARKEITRSNELQKITGYSPQKGTEKRNEEFKKVIAGIEESNGKKPKGLSIKDKFRVEDGNDIFYRIVYQKLCKETHSDMFEMERHFLRDEGGRKVFRYDVTQTDISSEQLVEMIGLTILETLIVAGQINDLDMSKYLDLRDQLLKEDESRADITSA